MNISSADAPSAWPPQALPIPARLNMLLVALVFAASLGLLTLASHVRAWWMVPLVAVVFSYVQLTNYALLHEATHGNLHPGRRMNRLLGIIAGLLFPIPFSFMAAAHQNHHTRNRTDSEMFDLYYETDNLARKYVQWYSILIGLFWPLVPFGAVVIAMLPQSLRNRLTRRRALTGGYVLDEVAEPIAAIRLELLLIVAFFILAFRGLQLDWRAVLICYAFFSFNWSTRQYIAHAFTKRQVIDGAWNLRHGPIMTWVLLHGEYDLNHHRRPDVSWIHLPKFTDPAEPRPSYLRQYFRQWLGPRLATEPPPEALLPMAAHRP